MTSPALIKDTVVAMPPQEPFPEIGLHNRPLQDYIRMALDLYFRELDGHKPSNLHGMVIAEAERPLLETVMHHAGGNQTRAAQMLGITRSTLRKKLKHYELE